MTPEAQLLADECKRYVNDLANWREDDSEGLHEAAWQSAVMTIDKLASMIPAGGLAEEARDAARYRHLTDVHGPRSELCFDGDVCAGRAEFDAMIDASIAALSAPTPQQEP